MEKNKSKKSEIAKMNDSEADKRSKKESDESSKKNGNNFRINENMVGEDE